MLKRSNLALHLQGLWENPYQRDQIHLALREKHTVELTDNAPSTFDWAKLKIARKLAQAYADPLSVLDIGSGDGQYLKFLLEQGDLIRLGVGLDRFNRQAPNFLQGFERQRWAFLQADARFLPFKAKSFRAAMANRMLNQTGNIAQALSEAKRVLEPDGRLFIVTASNEKGSLLRQIHEETQAELGFPAHFYHHSTKPDQRLGVDNGREWLSPYFSEIEIELYRRKIVHTELETAMEQYSTGLIFHKADVFHNEKVTPAMWVQLYEQVATKLNTVLHKKGVIEIVDGAGLFCCR
jgi:ubiquinone/menaquinone biosynthesis C-methylase UbiE